MMTISQGRETHPHIKRWCAGSCMAILALVQMAMSDLEEALSKTFTKESFLLILKKTSRWLTKELSLDLKIASREARGS